MVQARFALILVWVHGAGAATNSCQANMKFKSDMTTKCGMSCKGTCCELKSNICLSATKSCTGATFKDSAKGANAVSSSNFQAQCCTDKVKCASKTCPTGMEKKTSLPTNCASSTCGDNECCSWKSTTCGSKTALKCGDGSYRDQAKATLAATAGTTTDAQKTKCCIAQKKCATHTCSACTEAKEATFCSYGQDASACQTYCCKAKSTCCAGLSASCATDYYQDAYKGLVDVGASATADDKKSKCCTAKVTCKKWSETEAVSPGKASDAPRASLSAIAAIGIYVMALK